MYARSILFLALMLAWPSQAFTAGDASGDVFCTSSEPRQMFAARLDGRNNLEFAVGGANEQMNVFTVYGIAKPHKGGWRFQRKSAEEPDDRCTIDIKRAGGGFSLDTKEGARCVNAGGEGAWTGLMGLHFNASGRVKAVTKELNAEGAALLEVDCNKIEHAEDKGAAPRIIETSSTWKRKEPAYVGAWADERDSCDGGQIVITRRGEERFEGECRYTKVQGSGNRWRVTAQCTGEGGSFTEQEEFLVRGDTMSVATDGGPYPSTTFTMKRCD